MHFVFLTQYFPPETGAPPARLGAMVAELVALGHEVEVVTGMPNYPTGAVFPGYEGRFYRRDTWAGATVHRVWLYAAAGSGIKRAVNYLSFTLTCGAGLARAGRPDWLFVESPPLPLVVPAVVFCRLRRASLVLNVADLWPDSMVHLDMSLPDWLLRALQALERWAYRRADVVTAITDGVRGRLLDKGVAAAKLAFLPNGVDTRLFAPAEPDGALIRELGLEGRQVVLYAGTHGYAHGLDVALRAAALLAERDIVFLFVGDGSEKPVLMARARDLGLDNVVFLPSVPLEHVARLLSISVAGLATVRGGDLFQATRSAKVLPAMAAGRAVVYSGDGEGGRIVADAGAGLVTPAGDAEALAGAVARICDEPSLATELGRRGRAHAEEHAGWSLLIQEWLEQLPAGGEGPRDRERSGSSPRPGGTST